MTLKNARWLLPACLCAPLWMGAEDCTHANIGSQQVCEYDGKVYAPGAKFPSEDNCNTCTCTETGDVACTERACLPSGTNTCEYNGSVYAAGDSFPADDGCNTCRCSPNGDVACTLIGCIAQDGGTSPGSGGACEQNGKFYAPNTTFTIGCAGCACDNSGNIGCDAIACLGGCRFGDNTFASGTKVTCPDGCNTCTCGPNGPDNSEGQWTQTDIGCPALPKLEKCDAPKVSEVTNLRPLYLEKNALALELGYGGGCKAHSFRLCTDGALTKSNPGQLRLWVMDDGEHDPCEAFITETKVFDLSSLKTILGAQATGNITLRVTAPSGDSSVPYAF